MASKLEDEKDLSGEVYGEISDVWKTGETITISLEIGGSIVIPISDLKSSNKVEKGDSVRVNCGVNSEDGLKICDVYLEEECSFCGLITSLERGRFVVDNKIIVSRNLLPLNDEPLKLGDGIHGKAIKTNFQKLPFRAVSAQLLDKDTKAKLFPNLHDRSFHIYSVFGQKKSIIVSDPLIIIECTPDNPTQVHDFTVTNITRRSSYHLKRIEVKSIISNMKPISEIAEPLFKNGIDINPLQNILVRVKVEADTFPSILNERIILNFDSFQHAISLQIIAGTEVFCSQFRSQYHESNTVPLDVLYESYMRYTNKSINFQRTKGEKRKFSIKRVKPPHQVIEMLKLDEVSWPAYIEYHFPYISRSLKLGNYVQRWQTLLHIAELHLNKVFRNNYDQSNIKLKYMPELHLYLLNIPNVAEKRPSIMPGDVAVCHVSETLCFKGLLTKVLRDQVLIDMEPSFAPWANNSVDLNFVASTVNYRIQYEVLNRILLLWNKAIFPDVLYQVSPILNVNLTDKQKLVITLDNQLVLPLKLYNPNLNSSQLTAIKNVLRGEHRPAPYLISGPPGTGKTTTIVEIILQLLLNKPTAKLLVCAQSNSAANLILERLLETKLFDEYIMVRVISYFKLEQDGVPENLKKFCAIIGKVETTELATKLEDGVTINYSLEDLLPKRIVIITCGSVGYFTKMGFPQNHYSHLILDEAGQCLEPETIVPISLIDPKNGQIIMAGDEKQLGPVVQSEALKYFKYDLSLFERLLQIPLYDRANPECNHTISNLLIYNYRSVPSVLRLYNDLFYNSCLKSMISAKSNPILFHLPSIAGHNTDRSPLHSVFFYDIVGEDRQCANNPSWMNLQEAQVVQYLHRKMIKCGIDNKDIGIISPYHGQVILLKSLLPTSKVGSVAEFQGQERHVIILSTVRSDFNLMDHDRKHTLGFLKNEKRINVAISRAQYLLLIVGNSSILSTDINWKQILNYATVANAYIDMDKHFIDLFN